MSAIEGFVLAGGRSRRMGHDKANLMLGGKTLVERAATVLSVIADPVYAVGNLIVDLTSLPIIQDEPVGTNARGAIVGLYTALLHAKTEWAAILACDLPFVGGDLLTRIVSLLPRVADSPHAEVDTVLAEQPDGRIQPLCGLYRRQTCLAEIKKMLSEDQWRLQELIERVNSRILRFSEITDIPGAKHLFVNVNMPEDYRAAIAIEDELGLIRDNEQKSG